MTKWCFCFIFLIMLFYYIYDKTIQKILCILKYSNRCHNRHGYFSSKASLQLKLIGILGGGGSHQPLLTPSFDISSSNSVKHDGLTSISQHNTNNSTAGTGRKRWCDRGTSLDVMLGHIIKKRYSLSLFVPSAKVGWHKIIHAITWPHYGDDMGLNIGYFKKQKQKFPLTFVLWSVTILVDFPSTGHRF